jgi:hypothetical protein
MTCCDLLKALYEFSAQELPTTLHEEMRRHRDVCPDCAALVESYQITIRLARRLGPVCMPPECLVRLQAALRGSQQGSPSNGTWS